MPDDLTLSMLIGCLGIPCFNATAEDANVRPGGLDIPERARLQTRLTGAEGQDSRPLPAGPLAQLDQPGRSMR